MANTQEYRLVPEAEYRWLKELAEVGCDVASGMMESNATEEHWQDCRQTVIGMEHKLIVYPPLQIPSIKEKKK
jgi:hypothetical protein